MSLTVSLLHFDGQPFTRTTALAHGISRGRLSALVAAGVLRRLVRGVYVDALATDTLELRAAALGLVAPPDAVICRQSAAWLYGVDVLALSELAEVPKVESVRPPKSRSTRLSLSRGHSQTLLPGDVVEMFGLRVTSPAATAIHLARHLDRPFALSAVDSMLHQGLLDLGELKAAVNRYPHHPGIVQTRELVAIADPSAESPGESWLRLRMIDAGFPRPQAQVVVAGADREYRIDLGFPEVPVDGRRLGLEYDSDQWHSGAAADERDSRRQAALDRLGWTVLSVRRGDVWGRDPELELTVGGYLGIEPVLPRRW